MTTSSQRPPRAQETPSTIGAQVMPSLDSGARHELDLGQVRPPSSTSRRTAAQSLNRNRVAYRVARDMAVWLLEANLSEGTLLPPEQELCVSMGCSRSGIRSALRLLENWGLITMLTGREGGPVVRRPRVTDLGDSLSILVYSEHATPRDIMAARRGIDPIIAAEAAINATPEDIRRLDVILGRIHQTNLTQRQFLQASGEFDAALADASKLVILGVFMRILTSFGEDSLIQRIPFADEWHGLVGELFGRVRNAVAAHDSEKARAEMIVCRREVEQYSERHGAAFLQLPLAPFEFSR